MKFLEGFKKIEEKMLADMGIASGYLTAHIDVALGITEGLKKCLDNPIVDAVLGTVLPANIMARLPQVEAVLKCAITDLTIASVIEADLKSASTTEAKVKVFLNDLQKYNVFVKHAMLNKLCSLMLARLDGNLLTEVEYDSLVQGRYYLSK